MPHSASSRHNATTAHLCTHTLSSLLSLFFFNDTATTEIYTLSLHDALPISNFLSFRCHFRPLPGSTRPPLDIRSEEHTSELQSRRDLVCRLLLEKKKKKSRSTYRCTFLSLQECSLSVDQRSVGLTGLFRDDT